MPIKYNIFSQSPNDYYRELAQNFINQSWENTAAKTPENGGAIYEQNGIGSADFAEIEAWVKNTVGDVTSGLKDSADFIKIYFREIDHTIPRGLLYKFNGSYWICNSYGRFNGIAEDAGLRRCNNFLRIVDPENGSIFTTPCVVDYDMSSPSVQVSRYIITPNNHAVVMCQGNADTLRLFKTNTRFILGGRPFKLFGYQNAINLNLETEYDTLLYLDLYLDELHDKDDITNQIADNGEYNFTLAINAKDMELANGASGQLTANVTLNGNEVRRNVKWYSSNKDIVKIDQNGAYTVYGEIGNSVIVTAQLEGNNQVFDNIMINIVDSTSVVPEVYFEPAFEKIREYQETVFDILVFYDGDEYSPTTAAISLDSEENITSNDYLSIKQIDDRWQISCLKRTQNIQTLYVHVENSTPEFVADAEFNIQCVSMMG